MASKKRVLLKAGILVTMNPDRQIGRGDLYLEDGVIRGIGENAAAGRKVEETIDCQGMLVIPGLIQPHVHLCQTLFRGAADGLELLDWLQQRIWPFEAAHTKDSLYTSALLGGAELLRSGTTAVLDMGTVHHTDAIFAACKKLGLRATIGKAMMDAGHNLPAGLKESTEASVEQSIALARKWHGAAGGLLRYAFAPRFVLSCTEALMIRTVKAARDLGVRLHTHASENSQEILSVREKVGMDNVAYLDSIGMSGDDTVLAHCVWVTSEEQRLLRESGTHVVHCPSSNLKLASGIAKVPSLLEQGINVALAADGAPCSNNLDAFTEMRLSALIHNARSGPTAVSARTVVEMATLNGAKALGLADQIGSLEEGKAGDVTVVQGRQLHAVPATDPYSLLVYALSGRDVEHVFVDGVQRVRRGRVLGMSTKKLLADAEHHRASVVDPLLGAPKELMPLG